jgi:hypothetical protein
MTDKHSTMDLRAFFGTSPKSKTPLAAENGPTERRPLPDYPIDTMASKLPYLDELVQAVQDPKSAEAYALRVIAKRGEVVVNGWFKRKNGSSCSCSTTAFGRLRSPPFSQVPTLIHQGVDAVFFSRHDKFGHSAPLERCGVEIVSAQPNATGSHFSSKCGITIAELKQACKDNGIKVGKKDKIALLSALMKV